MRAAALGPKLAHNLDIFARALATALERDTQSRELLRQPSDTNAEDEPAAAQPVDCSDGLSQHERVMLGYETNAGRQPDLRRASRRVGQCRERVGNRNIRWCRKLARRIGIFGCVFVEQN